MAPGELVGERRAARGEDRMHDQAKLVERLRVEEAGDQTRPADDVDGVARPLAQRADLVDVADDPRRWPARLGERSREHQVRGLGGDARVCQFPRVWISA